MEAVRAELIQRAKAFGIRPENAGFLTAHWDPAAYEKIVLASLGVVFQLNPQNFPAQARALNWSGAVLGRLAEYVKLDREVRDRILAEDASRGLLGLAGGVYSLNLDLFLQSRQYFSSAA